MARVLRKGMKLKPNAGSSWANSTRQVELITSSTIDRDVYWWVTRTDVSGVDMFDTFNANHLLPWVEVKDFYRTGKKYRFKNGNTRDVYEIIEIHQVDRPISNDHDVAAVAKCHDHYSGKVYLTVLNRSDFDYMETV